MSLHSAIIPRFSNFSTKRNNNYENGALWTGSVLIRGTELVNRTKTDRVMVDAYVTCNLFYNNCSTRKKRIHKIYRIGFLLVITH